MRIGLGAGAAFAGVFLLAACATAAKSTELAEATDPAAGGKVCKRMPVMGSNFPKTVCSTAEEWAEFDRKTHESVESFDNDRRRGTTQGAFENQ